MRVRELADRLTSLCNEHGMGNAEVLVHFDYDEGGSVDVGVRSVADENCAFGRGKVCVLLTEE